MFRSVMIFGVCWAALPLPAAEPVTLYHAQGELAGEVTPTSVLLQSRVTAIPGPELADDGDVPGAAGVAFFEWSRDNDSIRRTDWLEAKPENDFIVRAKLEGLRPGTHSTYRLVYGPDRDHLERGPWRSFKTLPAADSTAKVTFCMGSCMNYAFFMTSKGGAKATASDEDKRLGYPSFAAMLDLEPDFFIGTGDIVYYDHPFATAAKTLPELRRKWHEQFRFPRMIEFFARTPAFWSKDDHDFRFDDADLVMKRLPEPSTGIDIFREQMPILEAGDRTTPTYRTHRINKHLQLWFTEGRDYRPPNTMPDGPEKSIWGREQRAWLERTLKASNATWKVIVTPTPMVGPDRASKKDNHTNPDGFRHEADEFLTWLRAEALTDSVVTFCGDRHWQYHSIHPLGMEEFSVGALNDENAIAGIRPGDTTSTDPEGLIKQPFIYPAPTGGFLYVTISPSQQDAATLHIEFRDDTGKLMYVVDKTPRAE
jgi:alkaline phosphatase/alkaline phosphatase D